MDRFERTSDPLKFAESELCQQKNVWLYDGDEKADYEGGLLSLTNQRLRWSGGRVAESQLALGLDRVVLAEKEEHTFFHSDKIKLTLSAADASVGLMKRSAHNHVKLSFRSGGMEEMFDRLLGALQRRDWERAGSFCGTSEEAAGSSGGRTRGGASRSYRAGIVGIEKKIVAQQHKQNQEISEAFGDLSQLMDRAREMVALSRQISAKIGESQGGEVSDDETVRLQSYLLSLGVADPVTRRTHGSGQRYHAELARELVAALSGAVRQAGGMMTLTDAYCRVNRARGLELISPDDLLAASGQMAALKLPLRLQQLASGVRVLQLSELDEERVVQDTRRRLAEETRLTAHQLAQQVGVSVLLARQRLLKLEERAFACRDDSMEGLVFYFNRFLHPLPS